MLFSQILKNNFFFNSDIWAVLIWQILSPLNIHEGSIQTCHFSVNYLYLFIPSHSAIPQRAWSVKKTMDKIKEARALWVLATGNSEVETTGIIIKTSFSLAQLPSVLSSLCQKARLFLLIDNRSQRWASFS